MRFTVQAKLLIALSVLMLLTIKGSVGNFHPNPSSPFQKEAVMGKPPFETSMERGRYAQVVSLVESGNINVDEFKDFLKPDLAWYNGHFYSTFPPAMAILSTPFYWVGTLINLSQVVTYMSSGVFLLLTVWMILKTANILSFSKRTSYIIATVFALSTSAWAYSASFSAHTLSAFVAICMLYLYLKIRFHSGEHQSLNNLYYFLMGLLFVSNILIDYPNVIVTFPIVLLTLVSEFKISHEHDGSKNIELPYTFFYTLLGLFLGFLIFLGTNFVLYGKPLYLTNTYTIKWLLREQDSSTLELSNDIFKDKNYLSDRFSFDKLVVGAKVLTVDTDRGVFQYFPFFVFGLIGLVYTIKDKRYFYLLPFICFVLNIIVYGAYDDPWGGWAFGPRYLIVGSPLFLLLAGYALERLPNKLWVRIPAFFAAAFGVIVGMIGALTTSAVPPSIEITDGSVHTNYLYNFDYLLNNGTSAFVYSLISKFVTPEIYFLIIAALTLLLVFGLFFVPLQQNILGKNKHY